VVQDPQLPELELKKSLEEETNKDGSEEIDRIQ